MGFPLHAEYLDSRASSSYEMFWPESLLSVAILDQVLQAVMVSHIAAFVTAASASACHGSSDI